MVIDLFGLEADEIRKRFPEIYQHILATVKPERDHNPRSYRREKWWLFGENVPDFRKALRGLPRFIATPVTQKHRFFVSIPATIIPDDALMCFALNDLQFLGILSSRTFLIWFNANSSTLENRPRFIKSKCFDPFPFPDSPESLKVRIRATAEELDALRKNVQAEHPGLTLTQIYNVLEKLRAGEKLDMQDEAIKTKGLVLILKELHEKLDALVAEAYGWPENLSDDEILEKLVALNAGRAAEEKRGLVRWLRPDYQRAKAGVAAEPAKTSGEQLEAPLVIAAASVQKPLFPTGDLERTAAVFAALTEAASPLDAKAIAAKFRQGRKTEAPIARILAAFARMGQFHTTDGARFTPRRGA
jgi:hypothetical protein